jgi:hypothetical protein
MPRCGDIKDTVIAVTVPLVLVILLALLGFAWRHARAPSAIEQPIARCLPPSEYELLHVLVSRKGDRIEASCAYLGPRGAYK